MLKSRLRCQHSCFDGTCNPDSPEHWFKKFLDSDADIFCQNSTIDDGVLPPEIVEQLKAEYAGTVFYDRFILGKWPWPAGWSTPLWPTILTPIACTGPPPGWTGSSGSPSTTGTHNPCSMGLWCVQAARRGAPEGKLLRQPQNPHPAHRRGTLHRPGGTDPGLLHPGCGGGPVGGLLHRDDPPPRPVHGAARRKRCGQRHTHHGHPAAERPGCCCTKAAPTVGGSSRPTAGTTKPSRTKLSRRTITPWTTSAIFA